MIYTFGLYRIFYLLVLKSPESYLTFYGHLGHPFIKLMQLKNLSGSSEI